MTFRTTAGVEFTVSKDVKLTLHWNKKGEQETFALADFADGESDRVLDLLEFEAKQQRTRAAQRKWEADVIITWILCCRRKWDEWRMNRDVMLKIAHYVRDPFDPCFIPPRPPLTGALTYEWRCVVFVVFVTGYTLFIRMCLPWK